MDADTLRNFVESAVEDGSNLGDLSRDLVEEIENNAWDSHPDMEVDWDTEEHESDGDNEYGDSDNQSVEVPLSHVRSVVENWLRTNGTPEQREHFGI